MSKGFTKDDAVDEPIVVPPRAPLPDGTTNYVTPRGLALLEQELRDLQRDKARAEVEAAAGDDDATRRATILATQLGELEIRLASAILVTPDPSSDRARLGCTVTVLRDDDREQRFRIVGVDEADATRGDLAFVSPLGRALLGARVGDTVLSRTPRGEEELEVLAIAWEAED
ncbi:MAG: GreA/GreB family elongation factor [Myxococcales bacterium]|nr:GreA/GreB family elongation factor [Myxococcales bacterium]